VMDIPASLRRWFVFHFVADILFAVPLIVAPEAFLSALGWSTVDPVSARLVGAALVGIGTQSLIGRNEGVDAFRAMLNLKLLWSSAAILGLLLSIGGGAPPFAWGILATFIAFFGVWFYYRVRIKQFAGARDDDLPDASGQSAAGNPIARP
jgi:hypothetical protein